MARIRVKDTAKSRYRPGSLLISACKQRFVRDIFFLRRLTSAGSELRYSMNSVYLESWPEMHACSHGYDTTQGLSGVSIQRTQPLISGRKNGRQATGVYMLRSPSPHADAPPVFPDRPHPRYETLRALGASRATWFSCDSPYSTARQDPGSRSFVLLGGHGSSRSSRPQPDVTTLHEMLSP